MAKSEVKDHKKDENQQRGNWSHKMDFLLTAVGFAVGLGNVWRFPYRAYQNGGASFLIPYLITLLVAGIPMFFLEMAVGQFSSLGPVSVWNMVPIYRGIGWGMTLVVFFCSIYYNMIIAYTLYYLFASMTSHLPWTNCREEWISLGCRDHSGENASIVRNITDQWCERMESLNMTDSQDYIGNCSMKPRLASELYWERVVLDMSEGIGQGDLGLKWDLALCLLLAWIIVFVCLSKGIKSTGKVVYVTAVFPYVVLVILLIWNAQLEGAWLGIKFYIIPKWERLQDSKVWYSAGTQIFYSLGIAFGCLETMASYNKFHNNVQRDAIFVSILNCCTSIFAGFVIFSVMGFMAMKTGLPVEEVVADGPGLAFIAYPAGLALMPVAPLWSILFFLMLFTLGIDSQFAQIETIITAVVDEFPQLQKGRRKIIFTLLTCICMYLLGLPLCSPDGIYVFTIFDWFSAGLNVIVICILEVTAIAWIYGYKNISSDIKMMIGKKPNYYFLACWTILTPAMMIFLFVYSIVSNARVSYGDYVFPVWADGIGWILFSATIAAIVIVAVYQAVTFRMHGKDWKSLFQPTEEWGPALDEFRTGRYYPKSNLNHRHVLTPSESIGTKDKDFTISVHSNGINGYVNEAFSATRF